MIDWGTDRRISELAELIKTSRAVLSAFAKAKTAKIGIDIMPR